MENKTQHRRIVSVSVWVWVCVCVRVPSGAAGGAASTGRDCEKERKNSATRVCYIDLFCACPAT